MANNVAITMKRSVEHITPSTKLFKTLFKQVT